MRRISILPLAGVVAVTLISACSEDPIFEGSEAMGPSFAPQPAVCDTRDLSKLARDYFPKDFDKQAQDLISALAEECAAEPVGTATDQAFDVMALMEEALGGVSNLDPVDGAALATELLQQFMAFDANGCEKSGCVDPGFADDVLLALGERGAFAVRGGTYDLTADVMSRNAEYPVLETDPAVWVLRPSQRPSSTSAWLDVLGPRSLLYGHSVSMGGGCDPATQDCPATDKQFDWNTLPDVNGFGAQMIVGACLVVDEDILKNPGLVLGMRRNSTVLEVNDDFDACEFVPLTTASLVERSLDFLSPWPRALVAYVAGGNVTTGPGGNASDFSDFTPVVANVNAELVFVASPGDASFGGQDVATLGQVQVRAQTVWGTPIEFIDVTLAAVDNNGATVVLAGATTRLTAEEGGIATFDDLTLNKTGGYQLCATAASGTYMFESMVCSERFNVKPN